MIASGREVKTTQCEKGSVSLKCEFLSENLMESGKWHHAIVNISSNGDVDVTIDNISYYQIKYNGGFSGGNKHAYFYFKGMNNSKAEINIVNSNEASRIRLSAWDSNGNEYMIASN